MDKEIENLIFIVLSNSNSISYEELNSAIEIVTNFQQSIEGFLWCINNFNNFQSKYSILFSLFTIRDWIINKWNEIFNHFDLIKTILFESSINYISTFPSHFLYSLSKSQVLFFINIYPNEWNDFFEFLLKLSTNIILSFLLELFSYFKENNEIFQNITYQMQLDLTDTLLLNFILNNLSKYSSCFEILVDMLNWIDPTPILNHSSINIIINGLINNEIINENNDDILTPFTKFENSIRIIDSIIKSPIEPSILLNFISNYSIIEHILTISTNNNFILSICSNIICSLGLKLLDNNDFSLFESSIKYLNHEDELVSESIIPYFSECIKIDSSFHSIIIIPLFYRYSSTFSEDFLEKSDFAENLLSLINKILRNNQLLLQEFINMIFNSINFELENSFFLIGSFFHILNQIHEPPQIIEIINFFSFLLQIEPPMSISQYIALSPYLEFFSKKMKLFNIETKQLFFQFLLNHSICSETNQLFASKFSFLIRSFLREKNSQLIFSNLIPQNLIILKHTGYISIASKLISLLDQNEQENTFQLCINIFDQMLNNEENTFQIIEKIFIFF